MTTNEFMDRFIDAIEHNKKYVSDRDLSFLIGKSENYINIMKNKKSLPNMATFLKICDLLDIDLSQFFKTNSDKTSNTKKTHAEFILFNQIKNLDKDKYKAVANIVDKLSKN